MGLINATGLWDVAAYSSTAGFSAGRPGELSIAATDRDILRGLAERVAAHAARPVEREKRDLWRRHNDLEATRPLVFCDPENGWNEIITAEDLRCRHSLARRWELVLRKELFWAERLRDDNERQPHDRPQPRQRHPLGADRPGGSRPVKRRIAGRRAG
jgi:hypothetical protein